MRLLPPTIRRISTSRWLCSAYRPYVSDGSKPIIASGLRVQTPAEQLKERIGPARTRFAPSPTGHLHLGSLRTALFNYLIAKATGGQFLLRIEDTDQKRVVPDAEERLLRDLEWAGIQWDEGPKVGGPYGPYRQSQRTALYKAHAEQLLESGNAYRCFCTPTEISAAAEFQSQKNLPPNYNRKCYHNISKEESDDRASKGEAHVIRLLISGEYPKVNDLVYGVIHQPSRLKEGSLKRGLYDDAILLKSDGLPTYHLANVVDDHLMEITHVIRGSEWMGSTPKHLALYQAFGWKPPAFAHVALLVGEDKEKLSKRHAATNLNDLRDIQGIFPETLTNFLALLGWSHRGEHDVMSMHTLIENASMKYTRGDVVVSPHKLWFLQKRHASRYASIPASDIANPSHSLALLAVKPIMSLLEANSATSPSPPTNYTYLSPSARESYVSALVYADAQSMKYTTPNAFLARNTYFFRAPTMTELESSLPAFKLFQIPSEIAPPIDLAKLLKAFDQFGHIPEEEWDGPEIKSWLDSLIEQGTVDAVGRKDFLKMEKEGDGKREKMRAAVEDVKILVRKSWARVVHGYVRWAMVAGMPGPDGAETMRILGREECLERLGAARDIVMDRLEDEGFGSLDG